MFMRTWNNFDKTQAASTAIKLLGSQLQFLNVCIHMNENEKKEEKWEQGEERRDSCAYHHICYSLPSMLEETETDRVQAKVAHTEMKYSKEANCIHSFFDSWFERHRQFIALNFRSLSFFSSSRYTFYFVSLTHTHTHTCLEIAFYLL